MTAIDTVPDTLEDQLVAIALRHRATPRHAVAGPDALSDLVVMPTLREAIIGNLLPPGSRLLEIQLSKQLGVSRTPMREAFAQLEREGLVTIVPRLGAFVRQMNHRDVDEIYTVRAALEGLAVELAAKNISPSSTTRLPRCRRASMPMTRSATPTSWTLFTPSSWRWPTTRC